MNTNKTTVNLYNATHHEKFKQKCKNSKVTISDIIVFFEKKFVDDKDFFDQIKNEYFEWMKER